MGYAYALGIIEVLKDSVTFGRFYIIAPENAESGGTNWNMFTEVWQYGSNENALKNTPKLQDGVAPQVSVPDIENKGKNPKGGRAYIPIDKKDVPQGFLKSHSIGNYKWIFTKLLNPQTGPGYVKPRL
jgi:hypothetical protein